MADTDCCLVVALNPFSTKKLTINNPFGFKSPKFQNPKKDG